MKYKICPKCSHKEVSFGVRCGQCGHDLSEEKVYEKPAPPPETVQEHYLKRLLFALAVLVVFIILSFVFRAK